jgi:DNA-binding transcriptional MerR regulator
MRSIGVVATAAGVSVRTLHHYDEIGLLTPTDRSDSGYRLYSDSDLDRLQQILLLRELGMGLDQIGRVLDDPGYDRLEALREQRRMLERTALRMQRLIGAVDDAIHATEKGIAMDAEEMLEVFGSFDPDEHAAEAKERWGGTDAYKQSVQRTASYTKQDWEQMGREADAINQAFIALMEEGVDPDDPRAGAAAERHRAHISKWFYECTPEIHAGLGAMYAADPRFEKSIDKAAPGLARYMSSAIAANRH